MESDSPRRPGRPRSERARRAALEAALALLTDRGLAAMSVDAVCERAGVSKATIYRHWESKERLCIEAVSCVRARGGEAAGPATDPGTGPDPAAGCGPDPGAADPRAGIVAVLRAFADADDPSASGRLLARLVGEAVDNPELARVWRATVVAPQRARLAGLVARAVEQGELRHDTDVDLVVDLLLGPLVYRRLVTGTAVPAPEQLVEAVWDGFRRRPC